MLNFTYSKAVANKPTNKLLQNVTIIIVIDIMSTIIFIITLINISIIITIVILIFLVVISIYTPLFSKSSGDRLYEPLGCFRDGNPRALPLPIKNLRKGINWRDMSETVAECAKATAERDPSLKVFALQFYGECFSGTNGLKTYDKYGALPYGEDKIEHCWEGVGSAGINFVYKFVD